MAISEKYIIKMGINEKMEEKEKDSQGYKSVSVLIPPRGRTSQWAIKKLIELNFIEEDVGNHAINVLRWDRERISEEAELIKNGEIEGYTSGEFLKRAYEEKYGKAFDNDLFTISVNLAREGRPMRIQFNRIYTAINNIPVMIKGEEHHLAPFQIRSGYADIALAGFDEILVYNNIRARGWLHFNRLSYQERRDLKIDGSAGLHDYTAHFIVYSHQKKLPITESKVYIDRMYEALYEDRLSARRATVSGTPIKEVKKNFEYSKKVEDDVLENEGWGVAIVNTGKTIRDRGLCVFSMPLVQSETLIIYHPKIFESDKEVRDVTKALQPLEYENPIREAKYEEWYNTLMENIGGRWKDRPPFHHMFERGKRYNYKLQNPGYHSNLQ